MTTMTDLVPLPPQYGTEILRTQIGSGVHGVTVSGTDDRDEMGICVEPPEFVIGLQHFEQWTYRTQPEGVRSGFGDLDLTVYSLRKWTRLACQGNPTVLTPLFVPDDAVLINTAIGRGLRAQPGLFLSRQTANRFLGYMTSQREGMLGLRGGRHTNRPELIALHGFDTKYAYHMIRLGLQGVELLQNGKITLPIPQPWLAILKDLRAGNRDKAWAVQTALELEAQLVALRGSADLPERPDRTAVNRWLIDVYQGAWSD